METGTLRAVPFKTVYESIVSRLGLDPTLPVPHNLWQAIPRNLNKCLRTAWTYWEWPYLEQCDERAFARTWLADHQFKAGEAVIFVQDLKYYKAKDSPGSGPPIGTPPTDTTHWDPLTDYGNFIPFDQICRRPMGMVLGVYPGDPRTNGHGCSSSCFRVQGNGIICSGGPTVFIKYQLPVPRFTLMPYAPGRLYDTSNLVYDSPSGECYLATAPSQNRPPLDPEVWLRQDFPAVFEDYAVAATYASCLKETSQSQEAGEQQQMRMMWARDAAAEAEDKLVEEIDKLRAMGQRYHYQAWSSAVHTMGRGYCPGVCFDPGQGEITPPPVTTLLEICETDATLPTAPVSAKVAWQYHHEIDYVLTSQGTPSLSGLLTKGTLALESLVEIVIVPPGVAGAAKQSQRYQLKAGAASPLDPGQVKPDDWDLATNNVHWERV